MEDRRLQREVLRGVSRSFYLSLRVLPAGMRNPATVAYLLARAADTIADTRALPPQERLTRLHTFRATLQGNASAAGTNDFWDGAGGLAEGLSRHEAELLRGIDRILHLLNHLPDDDQMAIRAVVSTLMEGMQLDLETFPAEDTGELAALETSEHLERYTYLVAGCVGEFWTAISLAHNRGLRRWNREEMVYLGVRFGKALQLTNVLRDVPRDLRIGRCYLPETELAAIGLMPHDLMDPANSRRARPVLTSWIETALGHFEAAEAYLLAVPRRRVRLRLAALWPILLGLATLGILARNDAWLDPAYPSRVSRRWVYGMLARSIPAALSDRLLSAWIQRLRRDVENSLHAP